VVPIFIFPWEIFFNRDFNWEKNFLLVGRKKIAGWGNFLGWGEIFSWGKKETWPVGEIFSWGEKETWPVGEIFLLGENGQRSVVLAERKTRPSEEKSLGQAGGAERTGSGAKGGTWGSGKFRNGK
jgi:hypothetical protein